MKKVSVILTTFNSCENFRMTMESILCQDYPEIEIVVKDGKSTDGTLKLIMKYKEKLGSQMIWKSEKDAGIYDAMNQGYTISTGDIIVFFNDMFIVDTAITDMAMAIVEGGKNCIGAHADLVYADGERIVRRWSMGRGLLCNGWMPGHPTLFLKREVYEKVGLYKTTYKCSADYEFMVRALYGREECLAYVPKTIVKMFYGGTSTGGVGSYMISLLEGHAALKENHIKKAWLIDMKRIVRVICQFQKAVKMSRWESIW